MTKQHPEPQPPHDAAETIAGGPLDEEGPGSLKPLRNGILASVGLILVGVAFLFGYAGALGNPKPHDIPVAVVAPHDVARKLDASMALKVHSADSPAQARRMIEHRVVYGALILQDRGHLQVDVAGGAGHAVALTLTQIGTSFGQQSGARVTVTDLAPLGDKDPNGTVEFYCIIFLTITASAGATVLGRVLGTVRDLRHAAWRVAFLLLYTAALSAVFTAVADAALGALTGSPGALFLVFWAYASAVCLALTGVAARLGTAAALLVTLTVTILGNTSAGGASPRPMLNSFFSALTYVFPQGAGMTLTRGAQYFDGHGISDGTITLVVWAGVGLVLLGAAAFRHHRQTRAEAATELRSVPGAV